MIKLIVGLGNPGPQYQKNRHNVGFLFLDYLLENIDTTIWAEESKFHGLIANILINSRRLILLKPYTFMNKSGLSVSSIARFYKIESHEILVVHDELDFEVGVVKLKMGGGHAGHNGLRDIMAGLGDRGFYRARLGIGRPVLGKTVDYVLSDFSKPDREKLLPVFALLYAQMANIVVKDVLSAIGQINLSR